MPGRRPGRRKDMRQQWRLASRNAVRGGILIQDLASLAFAAMTTAPVGAQIHSTGDGFLFQKPEGMFTVRGGYSIANATSDVFAVQKKQLTTGPRDFDALSLGADLSFVASRRVDLGVSVDATMRSHDSEYRDWLDNNNQPIKQTMNLSTIGFSANLK